MPRILRALLNLSACALTSLSCANALAQTISEVASFPVNRPTGIAASSDGRLFVNLPYSGFSDDRHTASVVEILSDGSLRTLANADWNAKVGPAANRFVNIQSLTIDASGSLWLLDTGSPQRKGVIEGGAKLIEADIASGQIRRTVPFLESVVSGTDYLNDVRVDAVRGFAYVTDSVRGGLIVMDLNSGTHRRVLTSHPFLMAEALVTPVVENVVLGDADGKPQAPATDGIALSNDGETVYIMYRPLAGSRSLISIPTAALHNFEMLEDEIVAKTKLEAIAVIADGIEMGPDNHIYFTDLERNAISRLESDGSIGLVTSSLALSWPDAITFGTDGFIYTTIAQFHRLAVFNNGQDQSRPPFKVFKVDINIQKEIER